MAGSRTKDLVNTQSSFSPELVLLVDKIDTGSGDWLSVRKIALKLLGNAYFQGSVNGVNWHDNVTSSDIYIRLSTDGGVTWKTLNTTIVQEGTNLYFTQARVLATPGVQNAVDNQHTHTNKTLLDNITSIGDGLSFLSNDGTYKNIFLSTPLVSKSANYTILTTDHTVECTANSFTITLPTASGVTGKIYIIKNSGTGIITINTTSGQTIDGSSSGTITLNQYDVLTVQSNGSNWIVI